MKEFDGAYEGLYATLFFCSALLVSYALSVGAWDQALIGSGVFIFWVGWQEGRAERRRPPR